MALVQVMEDADIPRRHGLSLSSTFVDGPTRAVPAVMRGDIDVIITGAAPAVTAIAQNADLAISASIASGWSHSIYADPSIHDPGNLVGKNIAITGYHSLDHEGILDRLRAWKINEDSVNFVIVAGGQANRLAALESGSVSAVALEPPLMLQAREAGFVELADLSTVPSLIATTSLLTTRRYLDRNQEAMRRLIAALNEAIRLYKSNEPLTIGALATFLSLDPERDRAALLATRKFYTSLYASDLHPSIEGLRLAIEMAGMANPDVAGLTPQQVIDSRGFAD
jgi:ABC-type nitrate/sulfonate/bicarbonate transport system substrate-binding protein